VRKQLDASSRKKNIRGKLRYTCPMPGRPPKSPPKPVTTTANPSPPAGGLALVVVVLFAFAAYWPLTRFYLAQDDFTLLERGARGFRDAMSPFFNFNPGQFRPLTKGLYFFLAWPLFGLNPLPYHIVSILLHAINAVLVGAVLRRMRISPLVSWLAAGVFAAHLCHIEAIAWASCVQQLMGAAFVFTALVFGLDALAGRGRRAVVAATVAYACALGSYEQTMAAPFVLLLWQWLCNRRRGVRPLTPMFALFGVYAVYAIILRGVPETGPYVMSLGHNVLDNLRDYLGLAFSIWHQYPAYELVTSFWSAIPWVGVIVVHAAMRSYRALVFGLLAFFLFLAPVMFTTSHTHSFHLYVPALAVVFLLASAAESMRRLASKPRQRATALVLTAATVVVMAGSIVAVRMNARAVLAPNLPIPKIFVLRRAALAERMCRSVYADFDPSLQRLFLVYPGARTLEANWRNPRSALGDGSAIRLLVKRPDLDVAFVPPDTLPADAEEREVLVFTELGHVMTMEQWKTFPGRTGKKQPEQ
jgi:hypothetical protein